MNALSAARLPARDRHGTFGQAEQTGEKGDEGGVRGPIYGRRGEAYPHRAVRRHAIEGIAPGAWRHPRRQPWGKEGLNRQDAKTRRTQRKHEIILSVPPSCPPRSFPDYSKEIGSLTISAS